MKVKIKHKCFLVTFWGILITFIFDIKIDVNICEPHYVNLLFFLVNLLQSLVFDILTPDIFHLVKMLWGRGQGCQRLWAQGCQVKQW